MKSIKKGLLAAAMVISAVLFFGCANGSGNEGSASFGNLEEDAGDVVAKYILQLPDGAYITGANGEAISWNYYTFNFYADKTFKIFRTSNEGKQLNYCAVSGTYSGDITSDSTEKIDLIIEKKAQDNNEDLKGSVITSKDIEYSTMSKKVTISINEDHFDFTELNGTLYNKTFIDVNSTPSIYARFFLSEYLSVFYGNDLFRGKFKDFEVYYNSKDEFSSAKKLKINSNQYYCFDLADHNVFEKGKSYYFWVKTTLINRRTTLSDSYLIRYNDVAIPWFDNNFYISNSSSEKIRFQSGYSSDTTEFRIYRNTKKDLKTAVLEQKIPYSELKSAEFKAPKPGKYYYWATTVEDGEEGNFSICKTFNKLSK